MFLNCWPQLGFGLSQSLSIIWIILERISQVDIDIRSPNYAFKKSGSSKSCSFLNLETGLIARQIPIFLFQGEKEKVVLPRNPLTCHLNSRDSSFQLALQSQLTRVRGNRWKWLDFTSCIIVFFPWSALCKVFQRWKWQHSLQISNQM